ncbi:glycosyltransferase family 2 protein [Actinoplanes sp. TFC3]|uniref:glycosyltransferase family 2 protein n=1 Tax=Actinoplanes sp. TFC3 TaxID=1710355 RepID=UPI000835F8F3|nr:glycosyltransferase family 2 protein [Actinoplanes sp. TFC3]
MSTSVSVVVPNYNSEKTLAAVLESVYAQTWPVAQVIVADDASTDRSPEIAARYPCHVLTTAVNRGVSAARNRGVAATTSDLVFFLDSDTALAPDAVANAVAILDNEPEVGCVHGLIAAQPLFDDGPVERYRVLHHYYGRLRGVGLTQSAYFAAAAVRREILDAAGPFDERLRDSEDTEYSDRLVQHTLIRLTDRVVAYHDDVDRLGPLLAETFRRAQLQLPVAAAHRMRKGTLKGNSLVGIAAAALVPATAVLTVAAPILWPLPVAFALLFAGANPGLSRAALRTYGIGFLAFFTAVHFLVHLALWSGAVAGAIRMPLARFRARAHQPAAQAR